MHPTIIDTSAQLRPFCDAANSLNWIALDTEFVRERTYFPQLGLIQVATPTEIVCIDPVAIDDLSPFLELLSNPDLTKILHSAEQDIEALLVETDHKLVNLFDTQIAAALLGMGPQLSYAALVESAFDIKLAKSQTRTNWTKRPLSAEQIEYAADDVRYLPEIHATQRERLKANGRLTWLQEDCEKLVYQAQESLKPDALLLKLKGHQELTGANRAGGRALVNWRETRARQKNLPRRWVLSDAAVVALANLPAATRDDLASVGELTPRQINTFGDEILSALKASSSLPPAEWPNPPRNQPLSGQQLLCFKQLRTALNGIAEETGLSPQLLSNRRDLERLAEGETDIPLLQGWRNEIAGKALAALANQ